MTHDQEEALSLSDRVVVMSEGRIEQIGTPFEIYNFPTTAFVASFVGTLNLVDAGVVDARGRAGCRSPARRSGRASRRRRATGDEVTLALRPGGDRRSAREPGSNRLTRHGSRTSTSSARSSGSASASAMAATAAPTVVALDTFNEPHLALPGSATPVTVSLPAGGPASSSGAARDEAAARAEEAGATV